MKSKLNLLASCLIAGLAVVCQLAPAYVITVPGGNNLIGNHLNHTPNNSIDNVFAASLAPLSAIGANPFNQLNEVWFTCFDNNTTTWSRSIYYENDFVPANYPPSD